MIESSRNENVSIITINKPKVNAIDNNMLDMLNKAINDAEIDETTNVILITGSGSFFSFGLDIPAFLILKRSELKNSIHKLLEICKSLYLSKKITIASVNGHATGAGCMIALSCDFKNMVDERAKIALNEINIGLSLFSSTIYMLKSSVGMNNSKNLLLNGNLINPDEALKIGLINSLHPKEELLEYSLQLGSTFKSKSNVIIKNMKRELSKNIGDQLNDSDESIEEFLDIFYLEETQAILKEIIVRK